VTLSSAAESLKDRFPGSVTVQKLSQPMRRGLQSAVNFTSRQTRIFVEDKGKSIDDKQKSSWVGSMDILPTNAFAPACREKAGHRQVALVGHSAIAVAQTAGVLGNQHPDIRGTRQCVPYQATGAVWEKSRSGEALGCMLVRNRDDRRESRLIYSRE